MKQYYQLTGEETIMQVNGTLEPLTEEQVLEHQEKYGPNELVEGKKKTTLQIFLEQYKDFLVIILIIAARDGLPCFSCFLPGRCITFTEKCRGRRTGVWMCGRLSDGCWMRCIARACCRNTMERKGILP